MTFVFTVTTMAALWAAGRCLVRMNRQAQPRVCTVVWYDARVYRQLMADPLDERWTGLRFFPSESIGKRA